MARVEPPSPEQCVHSRFRLLNFRNETIYENCCIENLTRYMGVGGIVTMESIMNGTSSDVILENGDSSHIPKMRSSISVVGEVFVENAQKCINPVHSQPKRSPPPSLPAGP